MPPTVVAYQHGIYPRSERLVQATRDLDRGRTTPEEVDAAFDDERRAYLELQARAGLDLISDGLLRWHDLFRPLVDATEGMDARVLVRWFDNNSFFRAPAISGTPRFGEPPAWVLEDGVRQPRVASLPSPYLFSRAAQGEGDPDELSKLLAREVIAPAARRLVDAGHALVHLEEPWLGFFGIEKTSWDAFEEAVGTIREATEGAALVLHVYYGNAAPYADRLRRFPVDAVGIDFIETTLEDLPTPWETGLVAGVVDGRRSVVESADEIVAFARKARERLQPETLMLTSGSELELAGPQVAPRKIEVLGEAARRLREEDA